MNVLMYRASIVSLVKHSLEVTDQVMTSGCLESDMKIECTILSGYR